MCKNILLFLHACSHTHTNTNTYTGTQTNIFWLSLSSNFSEYQPYLPTLNINNKNKWKTYKYSKAYHSTGFYMMGLFDTEKSY